jgi:hypothetical protein
MIRQHKKEKTGLKSYKRQKNNNVPVNFSELKIKIAKDKTPESIVN